MLSGLASARGGLAHRQPPRPREGHRRRGQPSWPAWIRLTEGWGGCDRWSSRQRRGARLGPGREEPTAGLGQWAGAAEGSWLRGSRGSWWPLCPLTTACCVPDGLHPGAAADADGGQAEAVSGQPAANHAESDTVIGEQESGAQLSWGRRDRRGLCCGTRVNHRDSALRNHVHPSPGVLPSTLPPATWRRLPGGGRLGRTRTLRHVKPLAAVES